MRAIWHGEQHLIFFVASFWLQKKLFGKTFWNKVVKKKRCGRSYWRCQDVIIWKIIALVVRRVGGLEVTDSYTDSDSDVVRRVGGLEVVDTSEVRVQDVVRRVGGLEAFPCISDLRICVVRRVGGLEGVGGITCESSAIDEETEAR